MACWGHEPERGANDHMKATVDRTTFSGLFGNPAFLPPPSDWPRSPSPWAASPPGFLTSCAVPPASPSPMPAWSSAPSRSSTASPGTLVGGWVAQRWLRTNHRALYLLSFWSVALTLPFGALVFFGPRPGRCRRLLAAEFFLFLNTGPLNAAIVNSVSAPVRATAIGVNLFVIHCFGDTFSPQIIGAISDHSNLGIGLGVDPDLPGRLLRDSLAGRASAPALEEYGHLSAVDRSANPPVLGRRPRLYFAGRLSWSRVFINARRPPCERKLGSPNGRPALSALKPRTSFGLGRNFGGPP